MAIDLELESTLCPICDEACTCPKSSNAIVSAIPFASSPITSKKSTNSSKKTTTNSSSKSKNRKKQRNNKIITPIYSDEEEVSSESSAEKDPALSFIRMIYSDEESLDEEEAYALYQAAQLFSSSSDEDENENDEEDEYTDASDESEFEYTVVEYVQQQQKSSSSEFVAYQSEADEDDESSDQDEPTNLLLNTEDPEDQDTTEEGGDSNNWMTYSVFDIDQDLPFTSNQISTSLSCQGSGTPDTLLFSTSSTDKIPNIAPQVLAAISAAAKHMAASAAAASSHSHSQQHHQNSNNNSQQYTKYFSYITLKDHNQTRDDMNGEEFLFFEEPEEAGSSCEDGSDSDEHMDMDIDLEEDEEESNNVLLNQRSNHRNVKMMDNCNSDIDSDTELMIVSSSEEFDSFSDDCSSSSNGEEINRRMLSKQSTHPELKVIPAVVKATNTTAASSFTDFNRWKRVPIGAFRRSRRPSIPAYNQIHPSHALKNSFNSSDPANLTLTTSLLPPPTAIQEDSFDEAPERAHSVISWDDLDLDININTKTNSNTSSSPSYSFPIPKRSKSVALPAASNGNSNSISHNFEWLNTNWNWE